MYIYIYICIYIPYTRYIYKTGHHVLKCMSCHKVMVVITGRKHCFLIFMTAYILCPSCF